MALGHTSPFHSFETTTEHNYSQRICAGETPQFSEGDLVFIKWDFGPDTYAVVCAVGTQTGPVRKPRSADVWTRWYHLLFVGHSGSLIDEKVHIAYDFEIQPAAEPLPHRFRMLELLSRHYKGESVISEEVLNRLINESVQVDDIESFPSDLFGEAEEARNAPFQTVAEHTTSAIDFSSTATPATTAPEDVRPELNTVFVALAMTMHLELGKYPGGAFDLQAPPAAFSSMDKAKVCAQFLCNAFLRFDAGASSNWDVMRHRCVDKLPIDVDPDFNCGYHHRIQIVEMTMSRETITDEDLVQCMAFKDLVIHTWCYNVDGELLWESPAPAVTSCERYDFESRYKIGDLVYVVPQGIDPESESIAGDVAVVSEVPISKELWLASGQQPESWNPFYTVDFVDPDYYLQHFHVPESSLLLARFSVPDGLAFLPLWSKHLRGESAFPDGLAERIHAREVKLRKGPRYDFSTGCIVD